jgi:hypothetical protein
MNSTDRTCAFNATPVHFPYKAAVNESLIGLNHSTDFYETLYELHDTTDSLSSQLHFLLSIPNMKLLGRKYNFFTQYGALKLRLVNVVKVGQDGVVSVVTHYGLDGPRIESRYRRHFLHLSRPTLGPKQPPMQ